MNFRSSTHYQRRDTKDGQLLSTPWALHSFSCVIKWLIMAVGTQLDGRVIRFPSSLVVTVHHHLPTTSCPTLSLWTTTTQCDFCGNLELLTGVQRTTMHSCCCSRYQLWKVPNWLTFIFLALVERGEGHGSFPNPRSSQDSSRIHRPCLCWRTERNKGASCLAKIEGGLQKELTKFSIF